MKHKLLPVGLALGLVQSALGWSLTDAARSLTDTAQSLSGKSKCKVCESQIRRGDVGFDDGFCPSHKDCKPCADGCGNWAYPDSPTGCPYCSQCQSKRHAKEMSERAAREAEERAEVAKERAEKEAREAKERAEKDAREEKERMAREEKERAERDEKRLREMYRSVVDFEAVSNFNERLSSCDLKAMVTCADTTRDAMGSTVKNYAERISPLLDRLTDLTKGCHEKNLPKEENEGIRNPISLVESNGVYQLSVVPEENFLASWKPLGKIPESIDFDVQAFRFICEEIAREVNRAKTLMASNESRKAATKMPLEEAKAIVDDPTQKYGLSDDEKSHPQLYKEFRAGMSKRWIAAWATVNDQEFADDVMQFNGTRVEFVFKNDILIRVKVRFSSPVSSDALLQKYKEKVGARAKVDIKSGEPEFDQNRTAGAIVAFVRETHATVAGADLRVSFSYANDVGFVYLLPPTVKALDDLKLWNEAEYERKGRTYLKWADNPGDLIVSPDGKVTFSSRDAKNLTKKEKDLFIATWAEKIDHLKHKDDVVHSVTITGVAAEAECEKVERAQKDKAARETDEKAKQKEAAALDF